MKVLSYDKGKLNAKMFDDSEIQEHLDSVRGAEEHSTEYPEFPSGKITKDIPDPE